MFTSIRLGLAKLRLFTTWWETLLLSLIAVTGLYLLSDEISVRLDSYHDVMLLFLALITLYNGTLYGIMSLAVITFGLYFFTLQYQSTTILEYLVFVLLLGEFHFHFRRRGREDREEKQYLKTKFRELSNAFYALKVSHDQLEKGYLLKPVTLRSLIMELAQNHKGTESYHALFETLTELFALKSALLCALDVNENPQKQIPLGTSKWQYDPEHPMLQRALQTKKPVFLAEDEIEMVQKEPILAVLPLLDSGERIKGIFVIEEMDFLTFNMENLLKIGILLEYLLQEQHYREERQAHFSHLQFPDIDARFQFETERLLDMYHRYAVHSAVVVVQTTDPAISLVLENFKTKKMRLLDMVAHHRSPEGDFYLFLLPLERLSGAISFRQRIEKELTSLQSDRYSIIVTEIDKIDTVEEWIREKRA